MALRVVSPVRPPAVRVSENKIVRYQSELRATVLTAQPCTTAVNSKLNICIRSNMSSKAFGQQAERPKRKNIVETIAADPVTGPFSHLSKSSGFWSAYLVEHDAADRDVELAAAPSGGGVVVGHDAAGKDVKLAAAQAGGGIVVGHDAADRDVELAAAPADGANCSAIHNGL